MLVKQAFLRFLEGEGTEIIFNLPGIHTLPLNHIFAQSKVKIVMGRHESNTAFMADGYARATGRPGVVLVTPGPGLGNVVSPCMEAFGDDVPMLICFIDVEKDGAEKGVLHGVSAPETIFANIAKGVFVCSDVGDFAEKLAAAYRTAISGRPGPVVLSIPFGILEKEVAPHAEIPGTGEDTSPMDLAALEDAVKSAKRPAIIGGNGLAGKGVGVRLDAVCRESGIPFLFTTGGKGVISEDRDHCFGHATGKGVARKILDGADLVIGLGTRLRAFDTKKRGVRIGRLAHIDTDGRWIGRNYRADAALTAPTAHAMDQVVAALASAFEGRKSAWAMEELKAAHSDELGRLEAASVGYRIIRILRRVTPENAITVWDPTMCGYWAEAFFPVYEERTFLYPGGMTPIFYALPAGIGAKLGRQDLPCLCVTGDGSFLPTASELALMAARALPVVVLVYNNASFGVLEESMSRRYGQQGAMRLANPDFVALTRSFGIKAERAETPEELRQVFLKHVNWTEPQLIDFRYPLFPPPWG